MFTIAKLIKIKVLLHQFSSDQAKLHIKNIQINFTVNH